MNDQRPVGYVSQDFLDGKWTLDHIAKSDEGQISRTIPVFTRAQPAPGAWQPIETAPKDGTWVLAINAETNSGRQHVVRYADRRGIKYPWETDSAPMSFVAGLTHWQPLPAPPTPSEQQL